MTSNWPFLDLFSDLFSDCFLDLFLDLFLDQSLFDLHKVTGLIPAKDFSDLELPMSERNGQFSGRRITTDIYLNYLRPKAGRKILNAQYIY